MQAVMPQQVHTESMQVLCFYSSCEMCHSKALGPYSRCMALPASAHCYMCRSNSTPPLAANHKLLDAMARVVALLASNSIIRPVGLPALRCHQSTVASQTGSATLHLTAGTTSAFSLRERLKVEACTTMMTMMAGGFVCTCSNNR